MTTFFRSPVRALAAGWIVIVGALAATAEAATAMEGQPAFATAAQITRISDLMNEPVSSADGKVLGRIEDIALNRNTGTIGYVVIGRKTQGLFDRTTKLVAVPLAAILDTDDGLALSIDAEAFKAAATFNEKQWPLATSEFSAPTIAAETVASEPAMGSVAVEEPAVREPQISAEVADTEELVENAVAEPDEAVEPSDTVAPPAVDTAALAESPAEPATDSPTVESPVVPPAVVSEAPPATEPTAIEPASVADTTLPITEPLETANESASVASAGAAATAETAATSSVDFEALDADADGYLNLGEVEGSTDSTIRDADANADGRIDRTEFAAFEVGRQHTPAQTPAAGTTPEVSETASEDVSNLPEPEVLMEESSEQVDEMIDNE